MLTSACPGARASNETVSTGAEISVRFTRSTVSHQKCNWQALSYLSHLRKHDLHLCVFY